LVVNRGLPATMVLKLFAYILPAFLEVSVLMAAAGDPDRLRSLRPTPEMIALRSSA
jgi:hypothetical protein